jgi:hypothetical protein
VLYNIASVNCTTLLSIPIREKFLNIKENTTIIPYTYNRGEWIETNSVFPKFEDDFGDWLESIGYESDVTTTSGSECSSNYVIHASKAKPTTYYAELSLNGHDCDDILIADFPSLMMFIRDYSSAFSLESIRQDIEQTNIEIFYIKQHLLGVDSSIYRDDSDE